MLGLPSVWISSVHPCVAWHIFCLTVLLLLNVVVFIANVALRITQKLEERAELCLYSTWTRCRRKNITRHVDVDLSVT